MSSKPQPAEMHEGAEAFNRFRNAMRTIVRVPKSAVVPSRKKVAVKKKKATK